MKIETILNETSAPEDANIANIKRQLKELNPGDFDRLTKMMGQYNKIKEEVKLWLLGQIKTYAIPQTELLKREDKEYYVDMIKASNYTATIFKIPSLNSMFKHLPDDIKSDIAEYFDSFTQKEVLDEFKEIVDGIGDFNSDCLGKECWNWQLFRNTYKNDGMQKLYSEREK